MICEVQKEFGDNFQIAFEFHSAKTNYTYYAYYSQSLSNNFVEFNPVDPF